MLPLMSPRARRASCVVSTRIQIERDLRAYGEEAVAARLSSISEEDFSRLGERAFAYATQPTAKKRGGMLLAKALALAAVEIIEGAPRELRRKRRVFS